MNTTPTQQLRASIVALAFLMLSHLSIGCTNDPAPSDERVVEFPDYAGRWKIAQSDVPDNMLALLTALRAGTSSIMETYDESLIEYKVKVDDDDSVVVESVENEEGTAATGRLFDSIRTMELRGDTLYVETSKYWMKLVRDPQFDPHPLVGKQGEDWRVIGSSRDGLEEGSVIRNGMPLLRFGSEEYIVELESINDSQIVGSGATASTGNDYDWEGIVSNVTAIDNGSTVAVTFSNGQSIFGQGYPANTPVTITVEKK